RYPWVIVLDCFAHQINLVVSDYFDVDSDILTYTDKASDLITWLRSKTIVLGLLRKNQEETNGTTQAILRAILTQWTAHLRAYKHLLIVRPNLVSIIHQDNAQTSENKLIITGDTKTKARSRKMCDVIKNNLFWVSLAQIFHHLRPLGIAANIIQASFCRLDIVLLTFGSLIATYRTMNEPEDLPGVTAIIESIERRWSKTDQEAFIIALIMNPFYGRSPLAKSRHFNNAGIINLMGRVFERVNETETVSTEFYTQLGNYLSKTGMLDNLAFMCELEKSKATDKVQ
ncbi:ribonuclease H-like domain-containing protein, partial [Crassisporium funariophilum]